MEAGDKIVLTAGGDGGNAQTITAWVLYDGWGAGMTPDTAETRAMDRAVSALHRQHRSDGRPLTFEPFRTE